MIPVSVPQIGQEEIDAVVKVLKSGFIAQGSEVSKAEDRLKEVCDAKFSSLVSNGTAALHCAVHALGLKPGDQIITTPFTFIATANAILMESLEVVFADIDEESFNISPSEIEKNITPRTRAIIGVDLFGNPCDYDSLTEICDKNGMLLISDASQAIGAEYKGRKIGALADITTFSFYATKNITSGEGGALLTNDEKYWQECNRFRHHGQDLDRRYEYYGLGYNYRLTDVQAAILNCQLEKLADLTQKRIKNAQRLNEGLKDIKGLRIPVTEEGTKHVFHQYTVRITKDFKSSRQQFMDYLKEQGIGSAIYYPKPLHLFEHLSRGRYQKGSFPISEQACDEVLSLPVHPGASDQDIEYIVKAIKGYVK